MTFIGCRCLILLFTYAVHLLQQYGEVRYKFQNTPISYGSQQQQCLAECLRISWIERANKGQDKVLKENASIQQRQRYAWITCICLWRFHQINAAAKNGGILRCHILIKKLPDSDEKEAIDPDCTAIRKVKWKKSKAKYKNGSTEMPVYLSSRKILI